MDQRGWKGFLQLKKGGFWRGPSSPSANQGCTLVGGTRRNEMGNGRWKWKR